jgi:hypothetical protein
MEYLSESVVVAAIDRGMDILGYKDKAFLGKYTLAYQQLKAGGDLPPTSDDREAANRYLDNLERSRRQINADTEVRGMVTKSLMAENLEAFKKAKRDNKRQMMNTFRLAKNTMRVLPKQKREEWLHDLIGYLLHEAGYASSVSFRPEVPPEEFLQGRGRPKKETEEEIEAEAASA